MFDGNIFYESKYGTRGSYDLPHSKNESRHSYDVIVIGAGIAGLSAANELHLSGYKVLVLEARERIGGRIHTFNFEDNAFLDLGASWIHGTDGNPIAEIADKHDVKVVPTDFTSGVFYDASGNKFPDGIQRKIWSIYYDLEDFIRKEKSAERNDIPLHKTIQHFISQQDLTNYELKAFGMLKKFMIDHPFNAASSELSLFYFDMGEDFPGDNALILDGYSQVLDVLARDLDIRLNHPVRTIDYEKSDMVYVQVNENTWFESKYVIVTVPLGVLKTHKIDFIPCMPKSKINSIEKLGFGLLNKVYLSFDCVFWDNYQEWIHIASEENMPQIDIMNYYKYLKKPILVAFFSGKDAIDFEKYSSYDIVKYIMKCLKKIYGDHAVFPKNYVVTRWGSDHYSNGSYVFLPVGVNPSHIKSLAEPIANKVFFAGEATEYRYCTTAHGAYLSGSREAKRIKKLDPVIHE